jgi:hypothetical protein
MCSEDSYSQHQQVYINLLERAVSVLFRVALLLLRVEEDSNLLNDFLKVTI